MSGELRGEGARGRASAHTRTRVGGRGGGAGAAPAFTFAPRSAARGGESGGGGRAAAAAARARGGGVPVILPTFHPRGTPLLPRVGRSAPFPNELGANAVCPGARRGRGQRGIAVPTHVFPTRRVKRRLRAEPRLCLRGLCLAFGGSDAPGASRSDGCSLPHPHLVIARFVVCELKIGDCAVGMGLCASVLSVGGLNNVLRKFFCFSFWGSFWERGLPFGCSRERELCLGAPGGCAVGVPLRTG